MKTSHLKFFVIFGILIVFSSCDGIYEYRYQLSNEADAKVKVVLKTYLIYENKHIDSTYIIAVNETKTLFITDHGVEGGNGPHFRNVSHDIDTLFVIKNDTLLSNINYLDNASWEYVEGLGLYNAVIQNDNFN